RVSPVRGAVAGGGDLGAGGGRAVVELPAGRQVGDGEGEVGLSGLLVGARQRDRLRRVLVRPNGLGVGGRLRVHGGHVHRDHRLGTRLLIGTGRADGVVVVRVTAVGDGGLERVGGSRVLVRGRVGGDAVAPVRAHVGG